jgi:hypothetical protein
MVLEDLSSTELKVSHHTVSDLLATRAPALSTLRIPRPRRKLRRGVGFRNRVRFRPRQIPRPVRVMTDTLNTPDGAILA